ncbi:thymidylate synthase [Candidatus Peregrinibacteria bacterium RIFOXYC2_FULL_33_13]|nr:MAG: Thymidylate synthase [Candidatus Peregrinibacteria bacterium GW2011_GWA2_33_10]KKP39285.1 MAG: thymidylate synthase, thymidylate synthase [Candidatus Peregrinibacteria bacterium GW2011_GWC2_33_13]OGJ55548.1 MAG: thymidylate synthase [Candidatus Peregrinibacteria bacterium RIFOXYC2_FULL_33_13]
MQQYLELVKEVMEKGIKKDDRTGTGIISMFGAQKKYDLREGFPLITTKKVRFDAIILELLWFLRGSTNINDELTQYTPMWDAWADPNGELGPIYGYQWRKWEKFDWDEKKKIYVKSHIDQIKQAIDLIKHNPTSRRIIVSAWNPADIEKMALPPCHAFFQFYVVDGRLDLQLYQRSADIALGVPYNIAGYSALLVMMAQECDLTPGIFVHTLGDAHIYLNHLDGLKEQINRIPHKLPTLKLKKKSFFDIKLEDFELLDYTFEPFIKFPVAV